MAVYAQLKEDMKTAMKESNKAKLQVVRFLISAIKNAAIDLKIEAEKLSDEKVIELIGTTIKQYKAELLENQNAGRLEGAAKVQSDIDILMTYLPTQLNEDEVKQIVKDLIAQLNIQSKKEMGKLMGALQPQVKGRFDGKRVNEIVQEFLA